MPFHRPKPNEGVIVPGDGPTPAEIMLVGERPGKDEAYAGRPFVGLSGQELDRYLQSVGLDRGLIYITNLIKTYAEHPPTVAEIEEWQELLQEEILSVQPRIIGAVGAHAAHWFLGSKYIDMDTQHGLLLGNVMPIIHPASAFYSPEQGALIQSDFQQLALAVAGKIHTAVDPVQRLTYLELPPEVPPPAPGPLVAIDTEGSREHPWCLTYSSVPGEAYCNKVGMGGFAARHVLLHNSLHDLGVLEAMGTPVGNFTDTMVLAYLLCTEPQGLKSLAYRLCGMEMMSYDDVIGPASRSVALEYLNMVDATDWGPAEEYVIIEKGNARIKHPQSINQRVSRILADCETKEVDPRKRWWNIDYQLREKVEDSLGEMSEATLDDVDPQVAVDYACRDADATLRIYPILQERVEAMNLQLVSRIDHDIIPMVDRMQRVGILGDPDHFDRLTAKYEHMMEKDVQAIDNMTGAHINPDSGDQVAELLFTQLCLPWEKLTKKKKRPATDDKVLEALRDYHPVVPLICEYREVSKLRNSFSKKIARLLRSSHDGRCRCNLRITRVSSGRLAASGPNLMAIPTRTELGREIRTGFIAGSGNVLATADLDQVEMRHMAHESEDERLCKLFVEGKLDVHTTTASLMFGVPYANVDPMKHRYPAKRVGFGVITGITGHGLKAQMDLANTGRSWSEDDCDELITEFFRVYPGIKRYMDTCRAEARRYGFVRDMWGRIRYLPGIHSAIPRIREEAARQAHSHKIQAGAQGIIKAAMRMIWDDRHEYPGVETLLQVHDELLREEPEGMFELTNAWICHHLTTAHLKHFPKYRVPLKAKGAQGLNWGSLDK